MIVTIEGRTLKPLSLHMILSLKLQWKLINEEMPWQGGTEISCIQKIPWIELTKLGPSTRLNLDRAAVVTGLYTGVLEKQEES